MRKRIMQTKKHISHEKNNFEEYKLKINFKLVHPQYKKRNGKSSRLENIKDLHIYDKKN